MDVELNYCETREVEKHRRKLAETWDREVSLDEAEADWIKHYLQHFRQARQSRMLHMQREEIQRHKWIESEKACQDLGRDAAMDWVTKYAAKWREWYDQEVEPKQA